MEEIYSVGGSSSGKASFYLAVKYSTNSSPAPRGPSSTPTRRTSKTLIFPTSAHSRSMVPHIIVRSTIGPGEAGPIATDGALFPASYIIELTSVPALDGVSPSCS